MNRIAICVGLALATGTTAGTQQVTPNQYDNDGRLERLVRFLKSHRSPIKHLAPDFLAASDRYGLDWRLLPSIAVVESGAGKQQARNNIFGWNSAKTGFATVREGIYAVAARLTHSKLYRDKDLDGILATYNRRPEYARRIKQVMLSVDSTEPLRARWMALAVAD